MSEINHSPEDQMPEFTAPVLTLKDALLIAKNGDSPPADRAVANQTILEACEVSIKAVTYGWSMNPLLRREADDDDLRQQAALVILDKVVRCFRIPDDRPEAEMATMFNGFARTVLKNGFRDHRRRIQYNGTRRALSLNRKVQQHGHAPAGGDIEYADLVPDRNPDHDGSERINERELWERVREAAPSRACDIAYLRYEGYKHAEIVRIMGGSARTNRDAIRKKVLPVFRRLLSAQGFSA